MCFFSSNIYYHNLTQYCFLELSHDPQTIFTLLEICVCPQVVVYYCLQLYKTWANVNILRPLCCKTAHDIRKTIPLTYNTLQAQLHKLWWTIILHYQQTSIGPCWVLSLQPSLVLMCKLHDKCVTTCTRNHTIYQHSCFIKFNEISCNNIKKYWLVQQIWAEYKVGKNLANLAHITKVNRKHPCPNLLLKFHFICQRYHIWWRKNHTNSLNQQYLTYKVASWSCLRCIPWTKLLILLAMWEAENSDNVMTSTNGHNIRCALTAL